METATGAQSPAESESAPADPSATANVSQVAASETPGSEQAPREPKPKRQNMQAYVQVYFAPCFGTDAETREFFEREGSPELVSLRRAGNGKYGFAYFVTSTEAQLFIEKFNDKVFGDVKMEAALSHKGKPEPAPPNRRLHITGYCGRKGKVDVSEREIWNLVAPCGFVRKIYYDTKFSFVDYDTVEDAKNAKAILEKSTVKGRKITVTYAKSAPKKEDPNLTVQLTDLIPSNHAYWKTLSEFFNP